MILLSVLATLLHPAHSSAIMAKPLNFKHCNAVPVHTGMGMPPPPSFRIGGDGALEFEKKSALLKAHTKAQNGAPESLVLKLSGPYSSPTDTQTVILRRKDGRPESLESTWRFAGRSVNYPGGAEVKYPGGEFVHGTRFAYERDGDCFVSQIYHKTKDGREVITFDNEACKDILAAAKKIGAKKLAECHDAHREMGLALSKHKYRLQGEGKFLEMTSIGMGGPAQPRTEQYDSGYENILAAGLCQYSLSSYGHEIPPEEAIWKSNAPGMAPPDSGSTETRTETAQ